MSDRTNKPNTGALFINHPKEGEALHPNAPAYQGRATIACHCCGALFTAKIDGWVKTAGENAKRPGEKYMALKVHPAEEQPALPNF